MEDLGNFGSPGKYPGFTWYVFVWNCTAVLNRELYTVRRDMISDLFLSDIRLDIKPAIQYLMQNVYSWEGPNIPQKTIFGIRTNILHDFWFPAGYFYGYLVSWYSTWFKIHYLDFARYPVHLYYSLSLTNVTAIFNHL